MRSKTSGTISAPSAGELATAAIAQDALQVRSIAQDLLRRYPHVEHIPKPNEEDLQTLAVAASLVELLALRENQAPPEWTESIKGVPQSIFLLKSVTRMPRLRELCQQYSPEPLRKRGIFAPPDYLSFA